MKLKLSIFTFDHYKLFLKALIKENSEVRGYKAFLAQSSGCERSYFSQVINSKPHLTPDHAFKLSIALEMNDQEREYWLTLVDVGRCADATFKRYLQNKLLKFQTTSEDLRNKLPVPPELPKKSETLYFSKWYMVAVHLLCGVIKSDQPNKISLQINMPKTVVQEAIHELLDLGLLTKRGENYKPTQEVLYVHKSSPLCDIHHISWRQQAIMDVQKKQESSLHVTAVHSLSHNDFQKIKQMLFSTIQSGMEVSQNSKEEILACLNIDYFHY